MLVQVILDVCANTPGLLSPGAKSSAKRSVNNLEPAGGVRGAEEDTMHLRPAI